MYCQKSLKNINYNKKEINKKKWTSKQMMQIEALFTPDQGY